MPSGIDPPSDEMRRSKFKRSRLVMVFYLLITLGAVTAIWLSKGEYRSVVTMAVYMDELPKTPLEFEMFAGSTEETLRQSEEILRPVIERFDLARVFSPNGRPLSFIETKDRLAESIEVRGIFDTGLLEVSVYHRNPELASGIANAIVENFNVSELKRRRKRIDDALAQFAAEIELQRTLMEKRRQEMTESKERGGIIDPDPESSKSVLNKVGADQNAINNYATAKARFLNGKKILDAGELKLRAEKQVQPFDKFEPVKIWKRADPSQHRAHIDLRRIWSRHKLMCILELIAGVALVGLGIVTAIVGAVKLHSQASTPLHGKENRGLDMTTYDY
jgi:uncharacterized protein involved in exopolysaccharide biosynthesis